jgi:spore coat polysaccharide biosynthesis predicted glycosyltransferase SpsG
VKLPRHAVFLTDANRQAGWGHLVRSEVLASALREASCEPLFVLPHSDEEAVGYVGRRHAVQRSEERLPPEALAVVDRAGEPPETAARLRARGHRVLWIDDGGRGRFEADLLLNQNLEREDTRYECPASCRMLLGPRYALVRSEFRAPVAAPAEGRRVLVTFGGSDPFGLTRRVARILAGAARVRAVVGPSMAPPEAPGVELVRGADARAMAALMRDADVAVGAAGSTAWELCLVGLPAVLLLCAENQAPLGALLQRRGAALCLGPHEQASDERIAAAVEELLADAPRRAEMARRARTLVDGRGAERVVAALGEGA